MLDMISLFDRGNSDNARGKKLCQETGVIYLAALGLGGLDLAEDVVAGQGSQEFDEVIDLFLV